MLPALAVACLLSAPAQAQGSTGQQSLIEDERLLLAPDAGTRAAALDEVAMLGADGVRALVVWREIAPGASRRRRAMRFRPGDPASYPAARWNRLDDLVRGAAARGLSVLLSPSTPAPDWASRCRGPADTLRRCRPDAAAYGAFVRALGRRYSGTYRDEDQGGAVLPRVSRWSFGNEPNQPAWLRPQFGLRRGLRVPLAAVTYRGLVRAGISGLRASGHRRDTVLLGETAPIGRLSGPLPTRPVPPAQFVRTLLCLDAANRPLAGAAAAVARCSGRFARLRVTGFAHHPYTRGGSRPADTRGRAATEITIASIRRLERILDAGARHGRIPRRLPIHYTEHGFQTDPPDRLFGVSLARQAEYLNQSDWIAFRNPRVRSVAQYKLRDDAIVSSFQSGLRFFDGRPKPSLAAYRLPIWVRRSRLASLRVYGQVRPLPARAVGQVEIQNAPLAVGAFQTVRSVTVRSANNTFRVTIPRREGRWRLRWIGPDGAELLSREALAADR